MSVNSLYLDLTELLGNPLRTGIQRVEREIIRHWPGPAALVPCRYDPQERGFVAVSEKVLGILGTEAAQSAAAELELLRPHLASLRSVPPATLAAGLFNPEIFYDPGRASAYVEICRTPAAKVSWLLFDFLPYLRPIDYPPGTARSCMHYLRALREVPRISAISTLTRDEYTQRIMRDPARTGPAFPLGGDALELEKQCFSPERKSFAYVGTIEPRKNVAVILEAFEQLWEKGVDAELTVIGRLDGRSTKELPMLERLEHERRFQYLGHASDATVRETLRKTRATIFVSSVEGFGIPPFEALYAGVPVIVSPRLPSTALLPAGGRITLPEVTSAALAQAVQTLMDDQSAARLYDEAARLDIPTWRSFAAEVAAWAQDA